MPNSAWMDDLADLLKPEDPANVASMFAGARGSVPIYAALYSKDASGPQELAFEARNNAQSQAQRDAQYAALQKKQGLAAIPDEALRRAVAARMSQEEQYPPALATRRADFAPQPRHEMRPYQKGGAVKGGYKAARELIEQALYHGGNYKKGDEITQPLFLTPSREMAATYVDEMRVPGGSLQQLRADISKPAPERLVNAAARKFVPENAQFGYTPASAFDANLHDPSDIERMIRELQRRGYDSAVASDIGMGSGSAPAVVAFPGRKAYAEGGSVNSDFTQPDMADGGSFIPDQEYQKGGGVKKSLQQMAQELMSKGVKTADTPDLARRSLFGLKAQPKLDLPLARMDDIQKDLAKAPAITEKSVTIDPGRGAAKSTLKSLVETPMSRRAVLSAAAGQVLRHALPGVGDVVPTPDILGEIAKIVDVAKPVQAAASAMPVTLQGIIARAAKMGLDEDDTIKMLEKMGHDEDDVLYMLSPMRNPYDFYEDLGEEALKPAEALKNLINHDTRASTMSLRTPLREIRRENPDMYKELKQTARDISEYGYE